MPARPACPRRAAAASMAALPPGRVGSAARTRHEPSAAWVLESEVCLELLMALGCLGFAHEQRHMSLSNPPAVTFVFFRPNSNLRYSIHLPYIFWQLIGPGYSINYLLTALPFLVTVTMVTGFFSNQKSES